MGYTHIVADDRKWENFTKSDQNKLIASFKEQVRQLEPQLLVVVGKKTYEELFMKSQPRFSGVMPAGFRPHVIKWNRTANDRKRGSTKIFLMRKTGFKSFEDRDK
jgi:hypothetical protein